MTWRWTWPLKKKKGTKRNEKKINEKKRKKKREYKNKDNTMVADKGKKVVTVAMKFLFTMTTAAATMPSTEAMEGRKTYPPPVLHQTLIRLEVSCEHGGSTRMGNDNVLVAPYHIHSYLLEPMSTG